MRFVLALFQTVCLAFAKYPLQRFPGQLNVYQKTEEAGSRWGNLVLPRDDNEKGQYLPGNRSHLGHRRLNSQSKLSNKARQGWTPWQKCVYWLLCEIEHETGRNLIIVCQSGIWLTNRLRIRRTKFCYWVCSGYRTSLELQWVTSQRAAGRMALNSPQSREGCGPPPPCFSQKSFPIPCYISSLPKRKKLCCF